MLSRHNTLDTRSSSPHSGTIIIKPLSIGDRARNSKRDVHGQLLEQDGFNYNGRHLDGHPWVDMFTSNDGSDTGCGAGMSSFSKKVYGDASGDNEFEFDLDQLLAPDSQKLMSFIKEENRNRERSDIDDAGKDADVELRYDENAKDDKEPDQDHNRSTVPNTKLENIQPVASESTDSELGNIQPAVLDNYPDNIDHLDLIESANNSVLIHQDSMVAGDASSSSSSSMGVGGMNQGNKPSRIFTIRNMNPSSSTSFSAMMSKMGEKHNMYYNEHKRRWEPLEGDNILTLNETNLDDAEVEEKEEEEGVDASSLPPTEFFNPPSEPHPVPPRVSALAHNAHASTADISGLSCLNDMDAALDELAGIDLSRITNATGMLGVHDMMGGCGKGVGDDSLMEVVREWGLGEVKGERVEGGSTAAAVIPSKFAALQPYSSPLPSSSSSRQHPGTSGIRGSTNGGPISATAVSNIDELDLTDSGVFDLKGFKERYPGLRVLVINGNSVSHLEGLPSELHILLASSNAISSMTSFRCIPNLRFLDLSCNALSDLSALSCLSLLQEVNLSGNQVVTISPLRSLLHLRILNVSHNALQALDVSDGFISLCVINASGNFIETVSGIENLRCLERILLDDNRITSFKLLSTNLLKQLSLRNNRLCESSFRVAVGSGGYGGGGVGAVVADLNLSGNTFARVGSDMHVPESVARLSLAGMRPRSGVLDMSRLTRLHSLRDLDVSNTPLSNLDSLRHAESLRSLRARACGVTHFTEDVATALHKLVFLDLANNKLTSCVSLPSMLERLDLSDNCLFNFRETIGACKALRRLRVLDLRGNPITVRLYPPIGRNNMSSAAEWIERDREFLRMAPDSHFIKRVCYRSLMLVGLRHLEMFDGVKVTDKERNYAPAALRKLKREL